MHKNVLLIHCQGMLPRFMVDEMDLLILVLLLLCQAQLAWTWESCLYQVSRHRPKQLVLWYPGLQEATGPLKVPPAVPAQSGPRVSLMGKALKERSLEANSAGRESLMSAFKGTRNGFHPSTPQMDGIHCTVQSCLRRCRTVPE
jgi:hypothetical protein